MWGAPPQDADGETVDLSFLAHQVHVTSQAQDEERLTDGFTCSTCHEQPSDLFSIGHFLVDDDTIGTAEVAFDTGLFDESLLAPAAWDGAGGCSNVYCHGYGVGDHAEGTYGNPDHADDFSLGDTGTAARCDDCHPSVHSDRGDWSNMSGKHEVHLYTASHHHPPASGCTVPDVDITCQSCHVDTTGGDGTTLTGPEVHVDGVYTVAFDPLQFPDDTGLYAPISWDAENATCTGVCHCENHTCGGNGRLWTGGGH